MANGDFALARKKLMKALDNRPDDGDLWWAVMLCNCGFRTDSELEAAVKEKFTAAAEGNEPAPPSPFDTSYCKNALMFAKNTKHRDFVDRVNAELSEIWLQKRGRSLKLSRVKVKKPMSRAGVLRCLTYAASGISAVGGVLAVYAIFAHATWALWSGFSILIAFTAAAVILRAYAQRYGTVPAFSAGLLIIMYTLVGTGLIIAGAVVSMKSVVILGAATVIAAAFIGLYRTLGGKRGDSRKTRIKRGSANSASGKPSRADYDRRNAVKPKSKNEKKWKEEGDRSNGYKDTFD